MLAYCDLFVVGGCVVRQTGGWVCGWMDGWNGMTLALPQQCKESVGMRGNLLQHIICILSYIVCNIYMKQKKWVLQKDTNATPLYQSMCPKFWLESVLVSPTSFIQSLKSTESSATDLARLQCYPDVNGWKCASESIRPHKPGRNSLSLYNPRLDNHRVVWCPMKNSTVYLRPHSVEYLNSNNPPVLMVPSFICLYTPFRHRSPSYEPVEPFVLVAAERFIYIRAWMTTLGGDKK